ncbi:hypothetical protein XCR1_2270005 [Xenorhabdus cabanillasii JM26]|uniref:Uncharacterized protein n=1 Tax=Xenorhabdus cabanillasii JM26 TaxID=1427517 RepID=W1J7S1_9GAMM|nr:hypothetical protein XCR1_2270005 [Xenorhabdus cabanillasii JM26]
MIVKIMYKLRPFYVMLALTPSWLSGKHDKILVGSGFSPDQIVVSYHSHNQPMMNFICNYCAPVEMKCEPDHFRLRAITPIRRLVSVGRLLRLLP